MKKNRLKITLRSSRFSVGDHYFNELRRLGRGYVHHALGTVSLGFLFGGGHEG